MGGLFGRVNRFNDDLVVVPSLVVGVDGYRVGCALCVESGRVNNAIFLILLSLCTVPSDRR